MILVSGPILTFAFSFVFLFLDHVYYMETELNSLLQRAKLLALQCINYDYQNFQFGLLFYGLCYHFKDYSILIVTEMVIKCQKSAIRHANEVELYSSPLSPSSSLVTGTLFIYFSLHYH